MRVEAVFAGKTSDDFLNLKTDCEPTLTKHSQPSVSAAPVAPGSPWMSMSMVAQAPHMKWHRGCT